MATYPVITFNDQTNYSDVEIILKQMFSDLNAQGGCCKTSVVQKAFTQAMPFLQAMDFDRNFSTQRWQADVKSAYILLQPVTSGPAVIIDQDLEYQFILA